MCNNYALNRGITGWGRRFRREKAGLVLVITAPGFQLRVGWTAVGQMTTADMPRIFGDSGNRNQTPTSAPSNGNVRFRNGRASSYLDVPCSIPNFSMILA